MMGHGADAAGVVLRHPFGDRELLEFLLSLPPEAKHAGGRWKALVRDGFPELPSAVRDNPRKTIFDEAVEAVHPLSRMRQELCDPPVPVPGVDYDVLRTRLESGRAFEPGDVAAMRRLALAHRFLAARG
jgi:hypothetical protein